MGAGNSMCGFGGGHNLTLSSSSWGSGSGLWDEYQKKKKGHFQGDVGAHIWTLPIREGGVLRNSASGPHGISPKCQRGLLQRPGRTWCQVVCGPLECRPWSTNRKTMMLRPQVQWGQSVSIPPDDSLTLREASEGWVGRSPSSHTAGQKACADLLPSSRLASGEAVSDPLLLPLQEGGEWTQGGQDQVKPAFLKPPVIKPHAELLNTQMSRHLFLRNQIQLCIQSDFPCNYRP